MLLNLKKIGVSYFLFCFQPLNEASTFLFFSWKDGKRNQQTKAYIIAIKDNLLFN